MQVDIAGALDVHVIPHAAGRPTAETPYTRTSSIVHGNGDRISSTDP